MSNGNLDKPAPQFAAVGFAIMRGAERVALAVSHTMAKRIANALNNHKPNQRGE